MMMSSSCKSSMNGVPEDLVIEILERLPVKTLVRFKCVCRRWFDLINSGKFISGHLQNTSRRNTRVSRDVKYPCRVLLNKKFNRKRMRWTREHVVRPRNVYDFVRLDGVVGNAFGGRETPYSVVGYCDGLFCLTANQFYRDLDLRTEFRGPPTIALCNPALKELRLLPWSDLDSPPYRWTKSCDIGFCFDPNANDYKVVKVVSLSPTSIHFVEVYSLRTNSWRTIISHPPPPPPSFVGTAATGIQPATTTTITSGGPIVVVLNWIMWRQGYNIFEPVIVSFYMDSNNEQYSLRATQMPTGYQLRIPGAIPVRQSSYLITKPPALGEKKQLGIVCIYYSGNMKQTWMDIWLMKEEAVGGGGGGGDSSSSSYSSSCECWDLAFTTDQPFPQACYVLGLWKSNVLMLYFCGKINRHPLFYDVASRQVLDVDFSAEQDFFYKESLISVKPLQHNRNQEQENIVPSWMFRVA